MSWPPPGIPASFAAHCEACGKALPNADARTVQRFCPGGDCRRAFRSRPRVTLHPFRRQPATTQAAAS